MNYQKYLTALLYSVEVPLSVWAGFELGLGKYVFGVIITIVMMLIEVSAVVTWMNAQTIEIDTDLNKPRNRRKRNKAK